MIKKTCCSLLQNCSARCLESAVVICLLCFLARGVRRVDKAVNHSLLMQHTLILQYAVEISPGIPSLHCAEELSACRDMHTKHTKAGQQELLRSSLCGSSASFSSQLGALGLVGLALTQASGACLQPCSLTGTD